MTEEEDRVIEYIKSKTRYDRTSGKFFVSGTRGRWKDGTELGSYTSKGYRILVIYKKIYKAHRVVWLIENGCFPVYQVDHINGNPDDNRITNLRIATNSENRQNLHRKSEGRSSKYIGVSKVENGKWRAEIYLNNTRSYLGVFCTEEDAREAYLKAKRELHAFADDSCFL